MTKPIKLSRKQITEGLKQTPIENILLGSLNADKVNLTKKQKDFARAVAEGKPKAQAYRENYNTTTTKQNQAVQASKLASNPKISHMIDAFKVANEAREYLIPTQIRAMAIQNLVSIAIDGEEKTSNKLKALELIGKMSEVALFTERKELIHTNNSADLKAQLLEGLRLAFSNSRGMNDLAKSKAQSLLIELEDNAPSYDEPVTMEDDEQTRAPSEIYDMPTPPTPDPQKSTHSDIETLHSNPHKGSVSPHKGSSPQDLANSLLQDLTLTAVIVTNPLESDTCASIGVYPDALEASTEGVGGIKNSEETGQILVETPPVNVLNEK